MNKKFDYIKSKFYGYILQMRSLMETIYCTVQQGLRSRYNPVRTSAEESDPYHLDVEEPGDRLFKVDDDGDGDGDQVPESPILDGEDIDMIEVRIMPV